MKKIIQFTALSLIAMNVSAVEIKGIGGGKVYTDNSMKVVYVEREKQDFLAGSKLDYVIETLPNGKRVYRVKGVKGE